MAIDGVTSCMKIREVNKNKKQFVELRKSEFKEVLSMKRWLSILAVLGCIVALSGCKNENGAKQAYFNAKVLEVNKEYVDVRCIEAFNSGISVDEEQKM